MQVIFVKEKSVVSFLEENLLGYKPNDDCRKFDDPSYNLIRDEMFFKKHSLAIGQTVKIELSDHSQMSQKKLKNIYTYKAEQYDDVSIKMVLEHFAIELVS
mgnify:CR=1 FL=1